MHSYSRELAKETRRIWSSGRRHPLKPVPKLPPVPVLEELLDVCYHASLQTEEHRRLNFRVVFGEPTNVHPWGTHSANVLFDHSRKFSDRELVRLAPATAVTQVLIGVHGNAIRKQVPALKIWGLVHIGSAHWKNVKGESSGLTFPPNALTVSSFEPGQLSISRMGIIVARLRRGIVSGSPSGWTGIDEVTETLRHAIVELDSEISTLASKVSKRPIKYFMTSLLYPHFIDGLLQCVISLDHGGAVLLLPDDLCCKRDWMNRVFNIKYECEYGDPWQLLVNEGAADAEFNSWFDEGIEEESGVRRVPANELTRELDDRLRFLKEARLDSNRFLASLTAVDGALLLSHKLRLIGFGAEILEGRHQIAAVRTGESLYRKRPQLVRHDSFGTRHRSALRACWLDPRIVAFVISQDGGIKVMQRVGEELVIWSDISLSGRAGL